MTHDYTDPAGIEAESMRRITEELARRKIRLPGEEMDVVLRVIHTTADFDFAKTLVFHNEAIARGRAALLHHKAVITDTNMRRLWEQPARTPQWDTLQSIFQTQCMPSEMRRLRCFAWQN